MCIYLLRAFDCILPFETTTVFDHACLISFDLGGIAHSNLNLPFCFLNVQVFAGDCAGEPAKVMKSKPWASVVEKLKTESAKPAYDGVPLSTHLGDCTVPADIPDGSTIR